MKKIFFLLPAFFLFIISCNNEKGNKPNDQANDRNKDGNKDSDEGMNDGRFSITGKWHIEDIVSSKGERPTEEEMKEMRSSTIEFTGSGTYIATSKDGSGEDDKEYGTYTFDEKNKKLETVEDDGGKRENFTFEFSGKNKIILTSEEGIVTLERD